MRAVVAAEDHDRVLVEPLLLELGKDLAHIAVQARDHARELRMGVLHGIVARSFAAAPRLVHEELLLVVLQDLVVGLRQLGVRQRIGEETVEGCLPS